MVEGSMEPSRYFRRAARLKPNMSEKGQKQSFRHRPQCRRLSSPSIYCKDVTGTFGPHSTLRSIIWEASTLTKGNHRTIGFV